MKWLKRKHKQIQRVISFLPIIWKGYDWDYIYAINIFKHQLERLADSMESEKAWGLTSSDRASKIRTAIKLMDKVYDEEYAGEYQEQIELLYGKTRHEFIEIKEGDRKGTFSVQPTNELAVDDEHQKEINEVSYQLFLLSRDKQEKAHRILWAYIEHNIQCWWD